MTEERKRKISRRKFLTGAGGLAAGLAAIGPQSALPASSASPEEGDWLCLNCGEKLDTAEKLNRHVAAQHARKLPRIRRVSEPTYDQFLVGDVQQFDQKNHVFSRTVWDEEYKSLLQNVVPRQTDRSEAQVLEGSALKAGAIYVDDTAGSLHPNYRGYSGHVVDLGGLYNWDDPVSPVQFAVSDPAQMSERIKMVARFYGADLVGICELSQRWVYSHYFDRETGSYSALDIPYKYAIVMGVAMKWEGIKESPGLEASAATALGYSRMAEVAPSLAKYIRGLGYPAMPSGNDTAQSIPLAIDAGLGELGRNGLLVTPEFGPRQRICKVLTDLPLTPDQPIDFGLQAFCERCFVCAHVCPAKAVRSGDRTTEQTSISNRPGILRWPVNVAKCYIFWQENGTDCANCVAHCPWGLALPSAPTRFWSE